MTNTSLEPGIVAARKAIAEADALLVHAGAGMGVDSGLPDFRGDAGFWKAYPPFQNLGLRFMDVANPHNFRADPTLAWGFYGHRLALYRKTTPHAGYEILRNLGARIPNGYFVFTSNVDAAFQRAGFHPDRVAECHGAIELLQCTEPCRKDIYAADDFTPVIDETTFRCMNELPKCPACGALARPNILMFGDGTWLPWRTEAQEARLDDYVTELARKKARVVVVECGAGTVIPSVRVRSERYAQHLGGTLIRINLREAEIDNPDVNGISIGCGALAALQAIMLNQGS